MGYVLLPCMQMCISIHFNALKALHSIDLYTHSCSHSHTGDAASGLRWIVEWNPHESSLCWEVSTWLDRFLYQEALIAPHLLTKKKTPVNYNLTPAAGARSLSCKCMHARGDPTSDAEHLLCAEGEKVKVCLVNTLRDEKPSAATEATVHEM